MPPPPTKKTHNSRSRSESNKKNSKAAIDDSIPTVDANSKDELCDKCGLMLTETPHTTESDVHLNIIGCEVCLRWFHAECANVSKEKFKVIQENEDISWYCIGCNLGAKQLNKKIAVIQMENTRISKNLDDLIQKVNTIEAKMETKMEGIETHLKKDLKAEMKNMIQEEGKALKEQIMKDLSVPLPVEIDNDESTEPALTYAAIAATARTAVRKEIEEFGPNLVREELEEKERIEQKKNNIMIFTLKECSNKEEAENHDIKAINEVVKDRLGLRNIEITNARRLGFFDKDKIRPVRVTLSRIEEKKQILSRAATLRNLEEEDCYTRLYVRPDLTRTQLQASKNLYATLIKKRQEQPNQQWKIRRGKIYMVSAQERLQ